MSLYEASSHLPGLMIDPCQLICKTQLRYETKHNSANLPHPRNHVTHIQMFCRLPYWTQRNLLARQRRVEHDPILKRQTYRRIQKWLNISSNNNQNIPMSMTLYCCYMANDTYIYSITNFRNITTVSTNENWNGCNLVALQLNITYSLVGKYEMMRRVTYRIIRP